MAIDLKETRIDLSLSKYDNLKKQLQGGILKSHGRNHTAHLLLRFTAEPKAVKQWIQTFARENLTSTKQQMEDTDRFHQTGESKLFVNFYLSADGYKRLGFDTSQFEETFRKGMKHREGNNKDPIVSKWEEPYQGMVHALITLADAKSDVVESASEKIKASVTSVAEALTIERGLQQRRGATAVEHFGYVDGRSNPLFLKSDFDNEQTKEWDPSAPLGLALAADPLNSSPDAFGSYFVFRKLEQNVKSFNQAVKDLAKQLGVNVNEDLAGAMVIGRFRDGTPVTLQPNDGLKAVNDFNYKNDKNATKCPFHGHIRKANQRGETPLTSEESERSRRIVRRGITYGKRAEGLTDEPESGVGLLFMCYQADIGHQFEFLMRSWIDSSRFPEGINIFNIFNIFKRTGDDPLIGQDQDAEQKWRTKWGDEDAERIKINFGGHVRLKGGEYFFSPSVGFLQSIAVDLP